MIAYEIRKTEFTQRRTASVFGSPNHHHANLEMRFSCSNFPLIALEVKKVVVYPGQLVGISPLPPLNSNLGEDPTGRLASKYERNGA